MMAQLQQISDKLRLCSYNSNGSSLDRILYIKELFEKCDILLIQEHWLYTPNLDIYSKHINDCNYYGCSGMDEQEFRVGRPYGGTVILWKSCLNITTCPINTRSKRLSAVKIQCNNNNILLFNVYMPCDSNTNRDIYSDTLSVISDVCNDNIYDYVIIGGDLNTDFSRLMSNHTVQLLEFLSELNMYCPVVDYPVADTYQSKINGDTSTVDHFLISNTLYGNVPAYYSIAEGQNMSDHNPLFMDI